MLKILVFLLSISAFPIDFSVIHPCENKPFLKQSIEVLAPISVSELTHYIFKKFDIPFIGDKKVIDSILDTPTGENAYSILTRDEIKVYGWCFQVNGIQPDKLMSDVILDPSISNHVNWVYGFAHYKNSKWITYCQPAYTQEAFICSNSSSK